jgi:F-type H+-transporting ATPase subunit gamma
MAGLKHIKAKIKSVHKTRTVTKAMEAVSAVKMRKSQQKALAGRSYARAAASVLARVSGSRSMGSHPLTEAREINRALYVVITSDKGLAGALNSGVLRAASRELAERGLTPATTAVVAVGRKAQDYFMRRGYTIAAYHPNTEGITSEVMGEIIDEAARRFIEHDVDEVRVVYQNFISTFEQRPIARTLFPLSLEELTRVVSDIVPKRGAYAAQNGTVVSPAGYTVEPSEDEVLNVLLPKLAGIILYHALLESQASEHSARMVAMKAASDKAKELVHGLTLQFNKARQAAITREVSEIIAGTL